MWATKRSGFTLMEVMIVTGIIGLLSTMSIPAFMKSRVLSHRVSCLNNLRQLHSAKEEWALLNNRGDGAAVVENEVNAFIKRGAPSCPSGGVYTYNAVGTEPVCSVGWHAF